MPSCNLSIEFDRRDRAYRTGEIVSGRLRIRVSRDVTCRKVTLKGYSQTHGRGNRARTHYFNRVHEGGDWVAGKVYEIPFEFEAPHYPLTYRGEYLNVDHYVHAQVDIPWAFDPKLEEDFVLVPGTPCHYANSLPSIQEALTGAAKQRSAGAVLGGLFLVIGVLAAWPTRGFSLLFAAFSLILLIGPIRRRMATARLGEVVVHGFDERVTPGERLDVELHLTPRGNAHIDAVQVTIKGQEVVVSGSGTDRRTHTHTFWEDRFNLHHDLAVQAHAPVNFRGAIQLPESTAYTLAMSDNTIVWSAKVHIQLRGHPDWVHTYIIQVVPPGTASVTPGGALPPKRKGS